MNDSLDTPDAAPAPTLPPDRTARKRHLRSVALAWTFGIALAAVYAVIRYIPAAGWRINDVTTGATPEYPELQSRVYDSSLENTTIVTAAVAAKLPRWKVMHTDPAAHRVVCEVKTPLGLFTDDVFVLVESAGPNRDTSRVKINSRSRVGKADLGQNAEHIRELQAAMDDKLPSLSL